MTTGYQIKEQDRVYFVTFQIVEWVDVFTRKDYKDIIIDSFKYCQKNKRLVIFAYVIMSNHIHIILSSDKEELSNTIRDLKRHISKTIIKFIEVCNESRKEWMLKIFEKAASKHKRNDNYQVWTHKNHAELIYSNKFLQEKIDYIHFNPVRAGIVENPEEYIYSSAVNYSGKKGLIDVFCVSMMWKTY